MKGRILYGAAAMLVLVGARTSFAQRIEPIAVSSLSVSTDAIPRHSVQGEATNGPLLTWRGVGGGILGGTAGLFGGLLAGAWWAHTDTCSGEDCSLGSALVGAAVGECIGLAAGVHVGSRRRGNLAMAVLASTGVAAAGLLAMQNPGRAAPAIMIAIPVVQLVAVSALER